MLVQNRKQNSWRVSNFALLLVVFKWNHGSGGVKAFVVQQFSSVVDPHQEKALWRDIDSWVVICVLGLFLVVYHSSPIHTTSVKQLNDVIKGTVSRLCPGSVVVFHEKKMCTSALIGILSSQCFLTV